MKTATAIISMRTLYQITRNIGSRKPGGNDVIRESDGQLKHSHQGRRARWTEYFKERYYGPMLVPLSETMQDDSSPSSEMEVLSEVRSTKTLVC